MPLSRAHPRRSDHWGRQGRGRGGQPSIVTGPRETGSSWEPSQACGVRGGRGSWSTEPSDVPGAECGLETASVNSLRVRKADCCLSGLQGRENNDILVPFSSSGRDCSASASHIASLPHAGPCFLGCPALVPPRDVRCHPAKSRT